MSKNSQFNENTIIQACEAAYTIKTPNLSVLAYKFNISYSTLRRRVQR
ncbi:hypothetical protein PENSTE_c024G06896 [Penicillium steckii]|uniref:HTH psq-type domain-containing protein n=1 Tax=Penicillium steckii TaxID=303698 RepID=A0A1V6SR37_9EURO|nr:hypothetical protein PENSTE_c024G06896 [Penicillium steckii]